MNIIEIENAKPIFSWCPNLDDNVLQQMKIIAKLPFVTHCALMPDASFCPDIAVGGVVACSNVIVPGFVGSDAGCGMRAIKSSLKLNRLTRKIKSELLHSFGRSIPTGRTSNSDKQRAEIAEKYKEDLTPLLYRGDVDKIMYHQTPVEKLASNPLPKGVENAVLNQLSTLGDGNHFLELQHDEEENIWIMVHCGSRNIGNAIWSKYSKRAKELNRAFYSNAPETIGFLPDNSMEGEEYLEWMRFALDFAYLNRQVITDYIKKDILHIFPDVTFDNFLDIHHNYATIENHFGKNMWVHRKGAVKAFAGCKGIIPGSMGTPSYITEGLGNEKSLRSCSHGAGRPMSRSDFNKLAACDIKKQEIRDSLSHIVYKEFDRDFSEAPQAYKSIEEVLSNQTDLVIPKIKLMPILSLKG